MKQILFFSALCYSLVMASCGGGATEKTSDESTAVQSVQQDSLQASADSLEVIHYGCSAHSRSEAS